MTGYKSSGYNQDKIERKYQIETLSRHFINIQVYFLNLDVIFEYKENIKMTGYKSSEYILDKIELKWLWLDAQAERINRKETKNESKKPHRHPLTD